MNTTLTQVEQFAKNNASRDVRVGFNCDGELVLEVLWIDSGYEFDNIDAEYKREDLFKIVDAIEKEFDDLNIRDGEDLYGDSESVIITL